MTVLVLPPPRRDYSEDPPSRPFTFTEFNGMRRKGNLETEGGLLSRSLPRGASIWGEPGSGNPPGGRLRWARWLTGTVSGNEGEGGATRKRTSERG